MAEQKSKTVTGLSFDARLPENTVTRASALKAFRDLRAQASDLPEMSLDEINAEISAARAERRKRMLQSGAFVNSTGRSAEEIDAHIRELKENDCLSNKV